MIKVNLLDPDGKKQKDSGKKGDTDTVKKENIGNSSKSKKPQDQKEENISNSSKSKKVQNQKSDKPFNNKYFFGFENNDDEGSNEEDNQVDQVDKGLKTKKSYIGWLVILIIIIIFVILYFLLSDGFPNKRKNQNTKKSTKIEQVEKKDVDSIEVGKLKHIEKKIANAEGKIENKIDREKTNVHKIIREKSKYKYIKNKINNSSRRLKVTSNLLEYIPNGLNIKYLSASKNELSFELISNKDDIIDRFFGILRKDKDFYDVKFKSIDKKYKFSKRSNFKVKFKKPASTTDDKLKNIDVNNFIDYIALTADKTNLSFNKILENDVKIISSPSMKENKLKMEFGGNLYQIRDFFNKINKIPGSFDIENIEIRSIDNGKFYNLILRIILFEKA